MASIVFGKLGAAQRKVKVAEIPLGELKTPLRLSKANWIASDISEVATGHPSIAAEYGAYDLIFVVLDESEAVANGWRPGTYGSALHPDEIRHLVAQR